ncbi:unnamed protein product [Ophioblennius macclurei]
MAHRMNPSLGSFPPSSNLEKHKSEARSFSRTPVSPESLIDSYKRGEIHAVSLLHHLAVIFQFRLELKETVTPAHVQRLYFAFCVVIDDVAYRTGMGLTKKDARCQAAQFALQELLPRLQTPKSGGPCPESGFPPHQLPQQQSPKAGPLEAPLAAACQEKKTLVNLQIPHSVRSQLMTLMNRHPEFSDCAGSTAAFIIERAGRIEVVAIGTGNVNARRRESFNGRVLHDSHAVVTARRSLMRFLYQHVLMFFSKIEDLNKNSIFEQSRGGGLLSLKGGISLHLYINQLPKGAPPTVWHMKPLSFQAWETIQDLNLHLSVEGKVFPMSLSADYDCSSNMISMSAADKLTQWQVVGYQGALLSHFIQPIYVHNILIGDPSCSETRGLEFCVSQRVEGVAAKLPMHYCMVRPRVILVPSPTARGGGSPSQHPTYSINWIQGDLSLEVVDGLEGRTVEQSPFKSSPALASRLCKVAMLSRFKMVARDGQREELLSVESYRKAKKMATPYQEAKCILRAHLLTQGYGSWLVKNSVYEHFNK